jgi:O-acetyl-ADP-ribose deacetylase (regulator of RNase III)
VVTSAGALPARFVFHGITLEGPVEDRVCPSRDLISEILAACFYHADTLFVKTMAFPLLGTGTGGFSPEVCLDTMFRFLARMLLRGLTSVREVRIVLFPRN